MKRYSRNIWVVAENNGNQDGFNIYLEFSGQREYLMTHRHSGILYGLLKDGVRLVELQRMLMDPNNQCVLARRSGILPVKQYRDKIRYLLQVIEEYIMDREECA